MSRGIRLRARVGTRRGGERLRRAIFRFALSMAVEIFGADANDPIPVGIRVGKLVHGLRINGLPAQGIEAQLELAFAHLRQLVERAGASVDNIAQVSFFLKQRQDMAAINKPWVELFPNEQDRPTYKFMVADLPGEELVHLQLWALAGERRTVLQIPGVAHTNPIPMGVRIGNMLFSSRVLPYDPETGRPAGGVERQAECLFENVRRLLAVGGARPEHITQARLFLADPAYAPVAEQHWRALVGSSDPAPVLHTTRYTIAPALLVMLELIAAL
jgi:2-iminobutanoate/2-iminopropanoate deaminase